MKSPNSYKDKDNNTVQMSLLSLSLAGKVKVEYDSSRIPSSSSVPSRIRTIDAYADADRTEPAVEPPMELNDEQHHHQQQQQQHLRMPLKDDGTLPRSATLQLSRNSIQSYLNNKSNDDKTQFRGSPLTSCSYQTMSKEYDMDTWRMYNRIQEARSQKREHSYLSSGAESQHEDGNEAAGLPGAVCLPIHPQDQTNWIEMNYGEEIFDLEL